MSGKANPRLSGLRVVSWMAVVMGCWDISVFSLPFFMGRRLDSLPRVLIKSWETAFQAHLYAFFESGFFYSTRWWFAIPALLASLALLIGGIAISSYKKSGLGILAWGWVLQVPVACIMGFRVGSYFEYDSFGLAIVYYTILMVGLLAIAPAVSSWVYLCQPDVRGKFH